MNNNPHDIDMVSERAKHLCFGPKTALIDVPERIAGHVNDTFVVIPRSILPEISFGTLDDAFAGKRIAQLDQVTEEYFNGDYEKMRHLGLQYLVMADYLKNKAEKEQADTAKIRRYKIYRELFPEVIGMYDSFDWDALSKFEQTVIDKMVLLNMEIDKNF